MHFFSLYFAWRYDEKIKIKNVAFSSFRVITVRFLQLKMKTQELYSTKSETSLLKSKNARFANRSIRKWKWYWKRTKWGWNFSYNNYYFFFQVWKEGRIFNFHRNPLPHYRYYIESERSPHYRTETATLRNRRSCTIATTTGDAAAAASDSHT